MNDIIAFNFIIFAAFLSALLIEVGLSLLFLIDFKDKGKIMKYLVPVWEIDGTFAIFYVVNTEATYPGALIPLGFMYIVPIMAAVLFFIFRNSFFGYAEFISNKISEKKYLYVYSIATLVLVFLVMSVFNSTVSGIGVNVSSSSINLLQMLFNRFNILMIIGELLLALFADMLIFNINLKRRVQYSLISIVLSFIFIFSALYVGNLSYLLTNISNELEYLVIPTLFIILCYILYKSKPNYIKFITPLTIFISILSFEMLEYPGLFNDTLKFSSLMVSKVDRPFVLAFGIIGGLILFVSLIILVYLNLYAKDYKEKSNPAMTIKNDTDQ